MHSVVRGLGLCCKISVMMGGAQVLGGHCANGFHAGSKIRRMLGILGLGGGFACAGSSRAGIVAVGWPLGGGVPVGWRA